MKLYHIMHGRPIGPSFQAYIEKPEIELDEDDLYGTWVEEVELAKLVQRFARHVEYMRAEAPESYFPYELEIHVRYPQKKG